MSHTLPEFVNPLHHAAEELKRGSYPNAELRDVAKKRRETLLRYAPHVTFGTNEVHMAYAMAKMAIEPGQRQVMRAYLDQLDAVDRAGSAAAGAAPTGVNGAALNGYRIDD